jgi:hypothetical protein
LSGAIQLSPNDELTRLILPFGVMDGVEMDFGPKRTIREANGPLLAAAKQERAQDSTVQQKRSREHGGLRGWRQPG